MSMKTIILIKVHKKLICPACYDSDTNLDNTKGEVDVTPIG